MRYQSVSDDEIDADFVGTAFVVLAVCFYCLHIVRNLIGVYAAIPVLVCVAGFFICSRRLFKFDLGGSLVFLLFAGVSFLPIIYSFLWYPSEHYAIPFFRYFYLVPFAALVLVAVDSFRILKTSLKVYAFFIVLAGVSIFYQIIFGPISWFAEASEREGLVRYASLAGSLTAFGVYSGLALPIIYFLFDNKFLKLLMMLLVVIAMLVSLQKAAVANLAVFLIMLFVTMRLVDKFKVLVLAGIFGPISLLAAYYSGSRYVVATVDNVLRLKEGSGSSDVSIVQSIVDRLWMLPSHLYELHGMEGLLFGVGMVGGSGTLGFPEYPMAHNGFFDLLFIGGVTNLVLFVGVCVLVLCRISKVLEFAKLEKLDDMINISRCAVFIFILFLINFLFAGVLYFHPYGGVVFYLIVMFFCFRWGVFLRIKDSCIREPAVE